MIARLFWIFGVVMLSASTALAQFDSGSDGSDGALDCDALIAAYGCPVGCDPCEVEIDLALAAKDTCGAGGDEQCYWDSPSPVAGQGVYDRDQWDVVFKYTTIDIPAGVTITFGNHPSHAPVIWLASGDVTVSGTVNLDGEDGVSTDPGGPLTLAQPGPGGFAGGQAGSDPVGPRRSGGFGPGGAGRGTECGCGGGYASYGGGPFSCGSCLGGPAYGSEYVLPFIGGSGGSGASVGYVGEGGAGGGAILIAASGDITLAENGMVAACGGDGGAGGGGGGSGGAIRLIANGVSGQGQLRATHGIGAGPPPLNWRGGHGAHGRMRVEAFENTLEDLGSPAFTVGTPAPVFPDLPPALRITQIEAVSAPADPNGGIWTTDVAIDSWDPVTISIEATNIPEGTTVEVRVIPERSDIISVTSTALTDGDPPDGILTAEASVTFPVGHSEVQLRANWTP